MIDLQEIKFGYSKKRVLFKDLNIRLKAGHIYGLLGKNGAGKTTLLKIMSGLCFPQCGVPTILGQNAVRRAPDVLSKIFFLGEEYFVPHLKIKDYVRSLSPFYLDFNYSQFEHYLKTFEIEDTKTYLDKLSFGQKKKVVISFALATNAQILMMDEPTNGLDIPSKSIFRQLLAASVSEEQLVIISTHQVRDLHSLIDAVVILDNGEIVLNEFTEKITQKLQFVRFNEQQCTKEDIVYQQDDLNGILAVLQNRNNLESKLDLELLFNAAMFNKEAINNIFNPKNIENHA
ncbi:MAG: ABC transporter ATP-binding protein [Bacteroidales bacterium]|jgi:ABC-2 type transport system ATP-binding protein|nr:ABC transporter ATP-binding protein [Bacteroidales bacterium]